MKNVHKHLPDYLENTALMNGEEYCIALDFQVLSWPGGINKTSFRLNNRSAVHTYHCCCAYILDPGGAETEM
jgi:hypothetical protein